MGVVTVKRLFDTAALKVGDKVYLVRKGEDEDPEGFDVIMPPLAYPTVPPIGISTTTGIRRPLMPRGPDEAFYQFREE